MTNTNPVLFETFKAWLPLAIVTVILTGLIYVGVQQNYRLSANDPQIQIAQDITTAISSGAATADNIVPTTPTADIAASLAPFVAIYSATTTPIGSSVSLNGKLPTLPAGVFSYADKHGEDAFTWQPQPGVRIAAVVTKFSGTGGSGYVLAGKSLKEIEKREQRLTVMAGVAGLLALILSFLAIWITKRPAAEAKPETAPTQPHNSEHKPI